MLAIVQVSEFVESKNTTGSGVRWMNKVFDFIHDFAKPNVQYPLCHYKSFRLKGYSCISFADEWLIVFKIKGNQFTVHRFVWAGKLR